MMLNPTGRTYPFSYPQGTRSTRTCLCKTSRASDTGARFIDFVIDHTKPIGFISKHGTKLAQSRIIRGFCHTSLYQFGTRNFTNNDQRAG